MTYVATLSAPCMRSSLMSGQIWSRPDLLSSSSVSIHSKGGVWLSISGGNVTVDDSMWLPSAASSAASCGSGTAVGSGQLAVCRLRHVFVFLYVYGELMELRWSVMQFWTIGAIMSMSQYLLVIIITIYTHNVGRDQLYSGCLNIDKVFNQRLDL
jgi:hypothetical protein